VFKNFYLAKHSGRILTLQPSAGTADLNSLFYSGKKGGEDDEVTDQDTQRNVKKHILCVNTYQMVILLMFNTRERLSYEEIKAVNIFINTQNKGEGVAGSV
jgi:cullin 3